MLVKKFLLQPAWQEALDELLDDAFHRFDSGRPPEGLSADWNNRFLEKYVNTPTRSFWQWPWLGYAAACIVLLGAGFYFYKVNTLSASKGAVAALLEKVNPKGRRSKVTLADRSVVYLSADSKLVYAKTFGTDNREIWLRGRLF